MSVFLDELANKAKKDKDLRDCLLRLADNACKIELATHIGKYTDPELQINYCVSTDGVADSNYVMTKTVNCQVDMYGSASYAATSSLLTKKLEDGRTVYQHLNNDDMLREDIESLGLAYDEIKEKLLAFKKPDSHAPIGNKLRQVFFPIGDTDHLLSVMQPACIIQELAARTRAMREWKFAARKPEADIEEYSEIYGMVSTKIGGANAQNVSIGTTGMDAKMLLSMPPKFEKRVTLPRNDFFKEKVWFNNKFKDVYSHICKCYSTTWENKQNREILDYYWSKVIDEIYRNVYELRAQQQGWSENGNLPREQAVWLDDKYVDERYDSDEWQQEVILDFARRLREFFIEAWKIEYKTEITPDDKFLDNLKEIVLEVVQSD